jgi:hypothetical protein
MHFLIVKNIVKSHLVGRFELINPLLDDRGRYQVPYFGPAFPIDGCSSSWQNHAWLPCSHFGLFEKTTLRQGGLLMLAQDVSRGFPLSPRHSGQGSTEMLRAFDRDLRTRQNSSRDMIGMSTVLTFIPMENNSFLRI